MPKLLSVICLAVVLPGAAHAQFSYDDFLRNVEHDGSSPQASSVRLAQATNQESSLPAPAGQQPALAPSAKPAEAISSTPSAQVPGLNTPQPAPVQSFNAGSQPVLMTPSTSPVSGASPSVVNFNQLFADEQYGLSTGPGYDCEPSVESRRRYACNGGSRSCGTGHCAAMAYYEPQMPPPTTLRGYFNASPCVANLWDNYACEAGKDRARLQQKLAPPACGTCVQ